MKNTKEKSKSQKIQQNKPCREQKTQDDKEFINDIVTLIDLRQQNQLASQAIQRFKRKVEQKQETLDLQMEQRDDVRKQIEVKMLKIILRQRGIQSPRRVNQSNNSRQVPFVVLDDSSELSGFRFFLIDLEALRHRLRNDREDDHEQQENQSDSSNQNRNS